MAVLSTHTLNSVDGTHAGGIALAVFRINKGGGSVKLLDGRTDEGGRFVQEIAAEDVDIQADYELVLQTGDYFDAASLRSQAEQVLNQVVVRFNMPDADRRYHIPFMLAPNSYSVWVSG